MSFGSRIQALLATAKSYDDQGNSNAAAAYYAKAELLMIKYRISEEEALAGDATSALPILHRITLATETGRSMFNWYLATFRRIADHCGLRFIHEWEKDENDQYRRVAVVVGYEGDVRYAEFLWTAASLMFVTRIDPHWNSDLPERENIWRMRNAGIERRVIADHAWKNGHEAKARSAVQRIYLAECKARNEMAHASGLGHQTSVFREAYAQSFVNTLAYRLQMAREAADSVGGGLVLHGRKERVEEAFYGFFPQMRPHPMTGDVEYVAPAPCEKCQKAKSGHCRMHPVSSWTRADEAAWQRRHNSSSSRAGQASGRAAAEGVIIARGHTPGSRLDASGQAIEG